MHVSVCFCASFYAIIQVQAQQSQVIYHKQLKTAWANRKHVNCQFVFDTCSFEMILYQYQHFSALILQHTLKFSFCPYFGSFSSLGHCMFSKSIFSLHNSDDDELITIGTSWSFSLLMFPSSCRRQKAWAQNLYLLINHFLHSNKHLFCFRLC